MKSLKRYLAIALTLLLVLTTQSMASARGMATPAGEMVLCNGSEAVAVLVDENGQPVSPPHLCPECSLGVLALAEETPALELQRLKLALALRIEATAPLRETVRHVATARGPPHLF